MAEIPTNEYFPETDEKLTLFEKYYNKVIKPSSKEVIKNFPSRSAKLRFATRNKNKFIYPKSLIHKFQRYLEIEALNV